jgi:hypothetical protein
VAWHRDYEVPNSSLGRRLEVVRARLRAALDVHAPGHGRVRLISMCAGDGRDVLPTLAETAHGRAVQAVLVELDARLADQARRTAEHFDLRNVEVRNADAGVVDSYAGFVPAQIALVCGVFGNVAVSDVDGTIAALRSLLVPHGIVIWTRGRGPGENDPSAAVREMFAAHGFEELGFTAPHDAAFRVGVHRLSHAAAAAPDERFAAGARMFTFLT